MSTHTKVIPMHNNPLLSAALAYASLGWHIFPCWWIKDDGRCACGNPQCKSPGKHPISKAAPWGQNNATTDPDTIRQWWTQFPQANIAVFLDRSGLCAIDIDPRNGGLETMDLIEAQYGPLASDLTQYTGGGGEHRVFLRPTMGSLPGKLGPGVDVKLNGYIMLEPSNHASGRQYSWEASSDPRDGIMASPLPDWLRDLAMQRVTAPPVQGPAEGRVLHITAEQQAELVEALKVIDADDRDTWLKVGMALQSTGDQQWAFDTWTNWSMTSGKYDPVDQLRVWRSIKAKGLDGITYRTVFELAKQQGKVVLPTASVESILFDATAIVAGQNGWNGGVPPPSDGEGGDSGEGEDEGGGDDDGMGLSPASLQIVHEEMPEVPAHLMLPPPGALRDAVLWINETSPKPQPLFAVQAAIAFAGTVVGRRFCTDNDNFASLFLLNIGQSGSGKEYARTAVDKLLTACDLTHLIGPGGYTSASGALSALLSQPNHVSVLDEFHRVLELASLKNNGNLKSMLTFLMTAWGMLHSVVRPQAHSTLGMSQREIQTLKERTVHKPAIMLLCMAVPDFWEKVGTAAVRDGFLNRFLIVESDVGRQVSNFVPRKGVPASLIEWAASIRGRYTSTVDPDMTANLDIEPVVMPLTDTARRAFGAFEAACMTGELARIADEAGVVEIVNRSNEIAMRLALILALSREAYQVDAQDAQWAIDYVRCHALRTIYRLKHCVADSEFAAACKQVYSVLARRGKPLNMARIIDFVPRMKGYTVQQRANVMAALVEEGRVAVVKSPTRTTNKGRKGQWFVAVERDFGDEDEDI